MTIREAIDRTDSLKPNQYSQADKLRWLSEMDGLIKQALSHQAKDD